MTFIFTKLFAAVALLAAPAAAQGLGELLAIFELMALVEENQPLITADGMDGCSNEKCRSPAAEWNDDEYDCVAGTLLEGCTCAGDYEAREQFEWKHEGTTYTVYTCCPIDGPTNAPDAEERTTGEKCGEFLPGALAIIGVSVAVGVILISVCCCYCCKCCCFAKKEVVVVQQAPTAVAMGLVINGEPMMPTGRSDTVGGAIYKSNNGLYYYGNGTQANPYGATQLM